MANVFLLYIPLGNTEAMVHYQDTIVNRVSIDRIGKFVSRDLRAHLIGLFGSNPVAVWGSKAGPKNRANYQLMSAGDDILIVEGDRIKLIGKIAAKTESTELSRELWRTLSGDPTPWQLIYFLANGRELDLPFREFCSLMGYERAYRPRGFTSVSRDRLLHFYERYDDLYSILVRVQQGLPIGEKGVVPDPDPATLLTDPENLADLHQDEIEEVLRDELVSDHVKMQWKLARLGVKAGERVWVPAGDQGKLRRHYQFDEFDSEFVAGIDLPHSYMENIDVIWRKEYQIGAAYEIENSTAIYSGLLRFADLNILAPNTIYPMFVVAPAARKNHLCQQLRRPTFKRLGLDRKVGFLSYESVDEIDAFFGPGTAGLSVDMIRGKAAWDC